ncbi:polysaccharide deacetylase family protein [Nocardioides sp. LML1-1-1.1]|uniref:polysaccharide deacetylase family protein n=1 Tax=Nocardioides sp. LML1-1-1.1 TaxID=3135248 RepID=UPI0034329823
MSPRLLPVTITARLGTVLVLGLLAVLVPLLPLPPQSAMPAVTAVPAAVAAPDPAAEPAPAPAERKRCVGRVALTFDDGPSPRVTPGLVRELQRLHVPATFFMVGRNVAAHPETARLVQRAGLTVGNHTWSHADLRTLSGPQVRRELARTRQALVRAGVRPSRLARPPYGALDSEARRALRREGLVPVLWTIDSRDWADGSTRVIARRILRALRPGDNVVLQHDGVARSPLSVAAVAEVVTKARRRGYCFTGLDGSGDVRH